MRYTFDHEYHIHSKLSLCSQDEAQNKERILKYALDNGLKQICVTDLQDRFNFQRLSCQFFIQQTTITHSTFGQKKRIGQ